jgi:hypothetical protein
LMMSLHSANAFFLLFSLMIFHIFSTQQKIAKVHDYFHFSHSRESSPCDAIQHNDENP